MAETYQSSWRIIAEHAGADLHSRGLWLCACPLCSDARARTFLAHKKGFCAWCGKILKTRKGTKYCRVQCRTSAFRKRKGHTVKHSAQQQLLPFAVDEEKKIGEAGIPSSAPVV